MEDMRRIIKYKTGIEEKNQRFRLSFYEHFYFEESNDNRLFWDYIKLEVYDISKYETKIKRNFYEKQVILDLNKKVEELKQVVFEQTKVPIDRQEFYLGDKKKETI